MVPAFNRRITAVLAAFVLLAVPPVSAAGPAAGDVTAASNAFAEGQRAELSGDHARAAEFYELADSIVASPQALRSATRNRKAAGDLAGAATLAKRLRERHEDDDSQALAKEILDELSGGLVRLDVTCDQPCTVSTDGRAAATESRHSHELFVAPGAHEITATFANGGRPTQSVDGAAGESHAMSFMAPLDAAPATRAPDARRDRSADRDGRADTARPRRARISPAWFTVGAAATAGLGAATIWSGMDVLSRNRDYERTPTKALYDDGHRAELRTNILIGVTAGVALATILLAVFTDWRRWQKGPRTRAQAKVPIDVGGGGLRGRF